VSRAPNRRQFLWGASLTGRALLMPGHMGARAREGHGVMTTMSQPTEPSTYVERRVPRGASTLYARDYPGAGPAFVLMHGFPDNLRIYDALAPLLGGAGRRVVAFDFLGYGDSDKPEGYPYSTVNLEGDLQAVDVGLELGRIVPVAHDASGPTAINWALAHPDQVAALALLNTYYGPAPTLRFPEFISLFADPAYADLAAAFAGDRPQFGWLLAFQGRQFQRDAPPARGEPALLPVIEAQFAATPSVLPAFMALTRDLYPSLERDAGRVPALATFARPVGLVWGVGDPYLNPGVAEHLHQLFRNSELTSLQAGHWPQIDSPEDVARVLLALGRDV
jgi:pimeloyl-ACP methyl ester carboxylesterase